MGAFFGSIHVRTGDAGRVRAVLEEVARRTDAKFLMGPEMNGWISVFQSEDQSDRASSNLAKLLPDDIFQFMVHDDDIFMYWFYRNSALVDRYNSCPDYFEGMNGAEVSEEEKEQCKGRPELFQDLLAAPDSLARVKKLLGASQEDYVFENQRMAEFVELLGLSNALSSYDYLQDGERDEIEGWEQFVHIEFGPQTAEDYNHRGETKRERGDLEGATADFKKALELVPDMVAAKDNLAIAEVANYDRSEMMAREHLRLAKWERDGGRLDRALAMHDRAIELSPTLAVAWNSRGAARRAKGDLDGAMTDFNKAIELNPGLAAAYSNRGLVKKAKGDVAGAMADYDKAILLKPGMGTAYCNRGELKQKQGDPEGAVADFNWAIRLKPDLAVAHHGLGELKRKQGDLDGALPCFDKAIELNPRLANAYNNRGLLKKARGDLEGALADYNKAIELKPDNATYYINRSLLKCGRKDFDAALADGNKAVELKPNFAEAHTNRALVKKAMGDLDGALVDLEKAVEVKPDAPAGYANRGEMKRLKGDLAGAMADFSKALELKPDWVQVREKRDALAKIRKGSSH